MALMLSELLSHLPKAEKQRFLHLDKKAQLQLRNYILNSARLPRSASELELAPGTVSGQALGRTRECDRGLVELGEPAIDLTPHNVE